MPTPVHPWLQWYGQVRKILSQLPNDYDGNWQFLQSYKQNLPMMTYLMDWTLVRYSWEDIQGSIGLCEIQHQDGRTKSHDYEFRSGDFRTIGIFNEFMSKMQSGPENDVYVVAQNHDYNKAAFSYLYKAIGQLPSFLHNNKEAGFFWIGGKTITPLHHDKTNNLMCQIKGNKTVRVVSPQQFDKIDYRVGVHSNIGWLDEILAEEREIDYQDYVLKPGMALFLPVGWWHCVKTEEPGITIVYTNFIWPNNFDTGMI